MQPAFGGSVVLPSRPPPEECRLEQRRYQRLWSRGRVQLRGRSSTAVPRDWPTGSAIGSGRPRRRVPVKSSAAGYFESSRLLVGRLRRGEQGRIASFWGALAQRG